MVPTRVIRISCVLVAIISLYGCQMIFGTRSLTSEKTVLPYLKNSANECYFLDEFMPSPSSLVSGRSGAMNLRYYTYPSANYKDWINKDVVLAFYSKDDACWSLYEEYLIVN